MLSQDDLDEMRHRAEQMATGYNTGDAARLYARDVLALMADLKTLRELDQRYCDVNLDLTNDLKAMRDRVIQLETWMSENVEGSPFTFGCAEPSTVPREKRPSCVLESEGEPSKPL